MNIFVLDRNPNKAAEMMIDKHIVKMVLETSQMLCTAVAQCNNIETPYKATYKNHPCNVWVRESLANFYWLCEHGLAIAQQYTERYGKIHKSQAVIEWCIDNPPNIPDIGLTPFAQAMPDIYKHSDAVVAYHNYYVAEKLALMRVGEIARF